MNWITNIGHNIFGSEFPIKLSDGVAMLAIKQETYCVRFPRKRVSGGTSYTNSQK